MTLYAKWNRYAISHTKRYTVSFQSNGGTEIVSQSVVNGSMAEEPVDPEKAGYLFDGWCSDEDTSVPYDFDTPVTSSITLYAKWAKVWTVTFSLDGLHEEVKDIANLEIDKIYVKNGSKITFPEISIGNDPLTNIKFKDPNTGIEFNSNSPISNDLILTAFIDDYAIAGNTYYVTSPEGLMAWAMAESTTGIGYNCVLLEDIAGGSAGENEGSIIDCYYIGNGTSSSFEKDGSYAHIGGITGTNDGSIIASYAIADTITVTATGEAAYAASGGITGTNDGSIIASYAIVDTITTTTAGFPSSAYAGGFVGDNSGTITAGYWS